jgi:hypothetical protein
VLVEEVARDAERSDIEFTSADNSLGIANIGLSGHAQLP